MYEQSMSDDVADNGALISSYFNLFIYILGRKKIFIDFMSKSEHSNILYCLFRVELFFEKSYFY